MRLQNNRRNTHANASSEHPRIQHPSRRRAPKPLPLPLSTANHLHRAANHLPHKELCKGWLLVSLCGSLSWGCTLQKGWQCPLNGKGGLSFQLFLITLSTISVPFVATKARCKTFACNCSVPGISMCSPCGLGLSPHGGGLAGVYVHGLGYDLVGLGA